MAGLKRIMIVLLCCSLIEITMPVHAMAAVSSWGVNGPNSRSISINTVFQLLQARGVKDYRFNVNITTDTESTLAPMVHDMVTAASQYGITLKPIIFTAFQYGDPTDAGKYPAGDAAALYAQGYNRTYGFVSQFRNDIQEWEMGNEINLKVTDSSGNRLFGKGWTAAEFDTPLMNQWASVLKGISDAIGQINLENGTSLRRTLNTTSTMFGFLDFMASKGVAFDVISYHYYETYGTNPHNYWGGVRPNFDLFQQLATYNRPVVFNEVNCAEIYHSDFENQAGQPVTENCFKSLDVILNYMNTQTSANIESVGIYELLDEPAKAPPENRFGLLYDLNTPKISLYILTYFSGGTLTSAERQELINRGFISN